MRPSNLKNVTNVDRVSDAVSTAATNRTTTAQRMYKVYLEPSCGRRMSGECHLPAEQTEECTRENMHVSFDT